MINVKIELDKTSIPAGPVKFIFDNVGKETHEVVLELAGDNDVPFEVNGKASEAEDIEPGKSATLEWTIDQPGEYQLGCHITENNERLYQPNGIPLRVDNSSEIEAVPQLISQNRQVLGHPISRIAENRKMARKTKTYGRKKMVFIKRVRKSINAKY